MSPWGDQTWTLEGNKNTSEKSKVAEQEVPALATPQRHQPNSIWTKIPLWEFQKTVNMLQYPQPISKPRMATLKWVRTVSFYLCSPPLPNQHSSALAENTPVHGFSLREERGIEWDSGFWEGYARVLNLSLLTQDTDSELAYFECLVSPVNKRAG